MSTIANKLRRKSRRAYIETYAFPTSLRNQLVDELGSAHKADIALDGLRAWYLACLYADGELIGMPSKAIDVAWHEMILRTREYHEFCRLACLTHPQNAKTPHTDGPGLQANHRI